MKRVFMLLSVCLSLLTIADNISAQKSKPRIGIAGIQIENSVFMPNRQSLVGHEVNMPDYLSPDSAMGKAATWLPALIGRG